MSAVASLDEHRRQRATPPDVVRSADERDAMALARGQGAAGRARALARHPDLAARVCRAHGLDSATQWSGYVPPREWAGRYNDSPLRRTVVEACAEAWRRENQQNRQENA